MRRNRREAHFIVLCYAAIRWYAKRGALALEKCGCRDHENTMETQGRRSHLSNVFTILFWPRSLVVPGTLQKSPLDPPISATEQLCNAWQQKLSRSPPRETLHKGMAHTWAPWRNSHQWPTIGEMAYLKNQACSAAVKRSHAIHWCTTSWYTIHREGNSNYWLTQINAHARAHHMFPVQTIMKQWWLACRLFRVSIKFIVFLLSFCCIYFTLSIFVRRVSVTYVQIALDMWMPCVRNTILSSPPMLIIYFRCRDLHAQLRFV